MLVIVACAAVGVREPDDHVWYAFMMIAVLLGATFLSIRGTIAVAVAARPPPVAVVRPRLCSHRQPPRYWLRMMSPRRQPSTVEQTTTMTHAITYATPFTTATR